MKTSYPNRNVSSESRIQGKKRAPCLFHRPFQQTLMACLFLQGSQPEKILPTLGQESNMLPLIRLFLEMLDGPIQGALTEETQAKTSNQDYYEISHVKIITSRRLSC